MARKQLGPAPTRDQDTVTREYVGQSSSRSTTVVVAALNSTSKAKTGADFICDGADDHLTINAALESLPANGGRVVLMEGDYNCPGPIIIDSENVGLEGQGHGWNTVIGVPSGTVNRTAALIVGHTHKVRYWQVKNLFFNVSGGTQSTKAGTGHGLVLTGDHGYLENVSVQYCSGNAFHYSQNLIESAVMTTIASASDDYTLAQLPFPEKDDIVVEDVTGFDFYEYAEEQFGELIVRKPDGRFAYVTFTGVDEDTNTFSGCTANWSGDDVFTLEEGDEVIPAQLTFNITTVNTMASDFGGDGYYIDWTNSSCEWILARCQGDVSGIPTTVGNQHGFNVQGTSLKFDMCHPYFVTGWGMLIGDKYSFSAGANIVHGGEFETCARGGIKVANNWIPVHIDSVIFYDNGLASAGWEGSDIECSYFSRDVTVRSCTFFDGPQNSRLGKNVYMVGTVRATVENCDFHGPQGWEDMSISNIYINGADLAYGLNRHVTVRDNRFYNSNSGSHAVQITGDSQYVVVEGNWSDARFAEVVATDVAPDNNIFRDNTLVPGQGAGYIILGSASRAHGAVDPPAAADSPGAPGQIAFSSDHIYVCTAVDTWKRAALSTWPEPADTGHVADLSIVVFGANTTRSAGTGDFPFGIKLQRAITFTAATYRAATADASGNLVVTLRRNGAAVAGSAVTIAAGSQIAGATATGSWAFAAGDIITVEVTGVGTTPGKGLIVDVEGTAT